MKHIHFWQTFLAILLAGLCWYTAFDLSLHWWWALWLAPIPILYLAPQVKGWQAFAMAFLAFLIGRLSWVPYLRTVLPAPLILIFTLVPPLLTALIVLAVRRIARVASPVTACFAYPVIWTAFEYLQFLTSQDGTIASIANTQLDALPVIQVASLTGMLGITFTICLFSSGAAFALYSLRQGKPIRAIILSTGLPVAAVLLYGVVRLSTGQVQQDKAVKVGLAAISMKHYHDDFDRRQTVQLSLAHLYLDQVATLARQGAQTVLLPEKGIPISDSTDSLVTGLFAQAARQYSITIIAGFTRLFQDHPECQARVFSRDGRLLLNYLKVNLFQGEVFDHFRAGKDPGIIRLDSVVTGISICKDLDFDRYIRRYGQEGVSILYVPAWDFDRDGWLHGRIAFMRAVENGYSLVRNARQGRLSISDDRGRVLAEGSCEWGREATLTGTISPSASRTLYSRWGNWFGWLSFLAAAFYLFLLVTRKAAVANPEKNKIFM